MAEHARNRGIVLPWLATVAAALVLLLARSAHAQQDVAAAAGAYARAQRAALKGNYARAAELFELADSLSPTPQALRSALDARRAAGQLALAAGDAEKLKQRYPSDEKSQKLADKTLKEAKKTLARQDVTCRPHACQLVIDGAAAGIQAERERIVYLEPGEHHIVAVFNNRRTKPKTVTSRAGESSRLAFVEPAAPKETEPSMALSATAAAPTAPAQDRGQSSAGHSGSLSPWFFGAGVAVTAALGGVTIWSGLDTLNANKTYKQHETQAGYQDGLDRQRRTNILIAATSVAAAATVTLALFTDFSSGSSDTQTGVEGGVAASRDGPRLFLWGRF